MKMLEYLKSKLENYTKMKIVRVYDKKTKKVKMVKMVYNNYYFEYEISTNILTTYFQDKKVEVATDNNQKLLKSIILSNYFA